MPKPAPRRPLPCLGAAVFVFLAACAPLKPPTPATPAAPARRTVLRLPAPAAAWSPGETRASGRPLRILLRSAALRRLEAPGGLRLRRADGTELRRLEASARSRITAAGSSLEVDGQPLDCAEALVEPLRSGEELRVAGRSYRGQLHLLAWKGRLLLLNRVGLEDYLRGVLPGEIGTAAPAEALKAQAVAARSFALLRAAGRSAEGWDLDDSADSQVYLGRGPEARSTDQAVEATRGEVLAWKGGPAQAFFHSNSGGHTADAAEVWGGQAPPYLKGVPDPWGADQKHARWSLEISLTEAADQLRRAGLWSGALEGLRPRGLSPSSRWLELELSGPGGRRARLGANLFRRALGTERLRSTRFSFRREGERVSFAGQGWGHGVGLSQEGAMAQAAAGRGYEAILLHYYPGAELSRLEE